MATNQMKTITKRDVIMSVPRRWREQYTPRPFWGTVSRVSDDKYEIADRLDRLNIQSASEKDIEAIVGNGSWTRMTCDQCRREVDALVILGEEPDYESKTAALCPSCVRDAFHLIQGYLK